MVVDGVSVGLEHVVSRAKSVFVGFQYGEMEGVLVSLFSRLNQSVQESFQTPLWQNETGCGRGGGGGGMTHRNQYLWKIRFLWDTEVYWFGTLNIIELGINGTLLEAFSLF